MNETNKKMVLAAKIIMSENTNTESILEKLSNAMKEREDSIDKSVASNEILKYLEECEEASDTVFGEDWYEDITPGLNSGMVGTWCIVRTYSAGVFMGKVVEVDDKQNVLLQYPRRLHKFNMLSNSDSISSAQRYGISTGSDINEETDYIQLNFVELNPCKKGAAATIRLQKVFTV